MKLYWYTCLAFALSTALAQAAPSTHGPAPDSGQRPLAGRAGAAAQGSAPKSAGLGAAPKSGGLPSPSGKAGRPEPGSGKGSASLNGTGLGAKH